MREKEASELASAAPAHQRSPRWKPVRFVLAVAVLAVVGLPALASDRAKANLPTCDYNHSSYAITNCTQSSTIMTVICPSGSANLRAGPGTDYSLHGTITGTGWHRYKVVFRSPDVQAGCGGPTTNQWNLSSLGWVTRSATNV
jgi:hypothetical protein